MCWNFQYKNSTLRLSSSFYLSPFYVCYFLFRLPPYSLVYHCSFVSPSSHFSSTLMKTLLSAPGHDTKHVALYVVRQADISLSSLLIFFYHLETIYIYIYSNNSLFIFSFFYSCDISYFLHSSSIKGLSNNSIPWWRTRNTISPHFCQSIWPGQYWTNRIPCWIDGKPRIESFLILICTSSCTQLMVTNDISKYSSHFFMSNVVSSLFLSERKTTIKQ